MEHYKSTVESYRRKDVEKALSDKIEPEPFMDDLGRVGNVYIGGAYGDKKIVSLHSPRFWKNEWELISEDHKKTLVNWINSKVDLDDMLYDQSLKLQAENPIIKYLVQEGVLPDIEANPSIEELKFLPEMKDVPENVIHLHSEAKSFMEEFMHHHKDSEISMIFQPKRLRLGFVVNDYESVHFIKFATLSPIWSFKTQTELTEMDTEEKLKSPQKQDEHLDKMFRTTVKHPLGLHWAGILKLNIAEMSTTVSGIQHALKLKAPRFKVEWINLKNVMDRTETLYESFEISAMIKDTEIEETNGSEKAPRVYPETGQIPWGEDRVLVGKAGEAFWEAKKLSE